MERRGAGLGVDALDRRTRVSRRVRVRRDGWSSDRRALVHVRQAGRVRIR